MTFSTIKRKTCKEEGCTRMPSIGYFGFCFTHAPQEIKDRVGNKRAVSIRNKAKNALLTRKVHLVQKAVNKPKDDLNNELELWFLARRHEMKGKCVCGCNSKSSKDDDKYYKYSAGHVLAKSKFESIALHPDNFVELAFWGGCHSILDDKGYEYCKETKPILWAIIVEKFKILYPNIAESELRLIPQILLDTL